MKPLLQAYDVMVVGGGFAGFAAAVQAARLGLKTLLVESKAQWGGAAYEGRHSFLCGLYPGGDTSVEILNPGISKEVADLLISQKHAKTVKTGKMTMLKYEAESLQEVFNSLTEKEKNLHVLFESQIEDVHAENGRIKNVRMRYQNQTSVMPCRAIIDCSGNGDVIRMSGAAYDLAPIHERQLAAYACRIDGVINKDQITDLKIAYHLAQSAGLPKHLRFSIWMAGATSSQGILRVSVLPSDAPYEIENIRKQAAQVHEALKVSMTEFKNSVIYHFTDQIVEREGLRMRGLYVLTKDDVLNAQKFDDGAVKNAWPVEFWHQASGPRYDYLEDGQYYEIPSRCLQSKDIPNLFCAGRCISADAKALASVRVTGTCLALGEQAAQEAFTYLASGIPLNIVDMIREETKNHRVRTALREGTRTVSYAELMQKTEQLAGLLKDLPVKKYARTGLLVREGIDYVILNLAVLSLQVVIVPVPQASSKDEIDQIIRDMKLDLLIYEKSLYSAEENISVIGAFDQRPLEAVFFKAEMKEQNEFESLNPAFIRFTSGTTGQSKGVVISHESIRDRTEGADQALKITHNDTVIWVLSMAYHFIVTILLFLRRGAAIVLCEHEIPKGLIEGLRQGDATFIYAAPVHYEAMANTTEINPAHYSHVRMAVCTTAHLSPSAAEAFAAKFGFELSPAYGVIELGLPCVNDSGIAEKRRSAGRILSGYECRLEGTDKEGTGIVQIKGAGFFDAYFSPWQTRNQVVRDGWFETGDLGRLDKDGFLFLLGRNQQVINFMGMKIFPREIEEVLQQNPLIEQAYVYGEDHSVYGQMPCAKIVLKTDQTNFNEDELRKFCYANLPSYKVPKKFECVQELKKTKSGKVRLDQ